MRARDARGCYGTVLLVVGVVEIEAEALALGAVGVGGSDGLNPSHVHDVPRAIEAVRAEPRAELEFGSVGERRRRGPRDRARHGEALGEAGFAERVAGEVAQQRGDASHHSRVSGDRRSSSRAQYATPGGIARAPGDAP